MTACETVTWTKTAKWLLISTVFLGSVFLSLVQNQVWTQEPFSSTTDLIPVSNVPYPSVTICVDSSKDSRIFLDAIKRSSTDDDWNKSLMQFVLANRKLKLDLMQDLISSFNLLGTKAKVNVVSSSLRHIPKLACTAFSKRDKAPTYLQTFLLALLDRWLQVGSSSSSQMEDVVSSTIEDIVMLTTDPSVYTCQLTKGLVATSIGKELDVFLARANFIRGRLLSSTSSLADYLLQFLTSNQGGPYWSQFLDQLYDGSGFGSSSSLRGEIEAIQWAWTFFNVNADSSVAGLYDAIFPNGNCGEKKGKEEENCRVASLNKKFTITLVQQDRLKKSREKLYQNVNNVIPLCHFGSTARSQLQKCSRMFQRAPNLMAASPSKQCYTYNGDISQDPVTTLDHHAGNGGSPEQDHGLSLVVRTGASDATFGSNNIEVFVHNRGTIPGVKFLVNGEMLQLEPGYAYNIHAKVIQHDVTNQFQRLSRSNRRCYLEDDQEDLDLPSLRQHGITYQGLTLIHALRSAIGNCSCIPGHLWKEVVLDPQQVMAECDLNGLLCFYNQNTSQMADHFWEKTGATPCFALYYSAAVSSRTAPQQLKPIGETGLWTTKIVINFGKPYMYKIITDKAVTSIGMFGTLGGIFNMIHGFSFTSLIVFLLDKLRDRLIGTSRRNQVDIIVDDILDDELEEDKTKPSGLQ